jgi:hypothetical protein
MPADPSYDGSGPLPTVGDLMRNGDGGPTQVKITTSSQSALAILVRRAPGVGYIGPLVGIPGRKESRIITNLDPSSLDPDNFLDLSRKTRIVLRVLGKRLRPRYIRAASAPRVETRFPSGTHGFLYAAGEDSTIRFRVMKDAHPYSFPLGHDLRRPDGQLWTWRPKTLGGLV